MLHYLIMQKKKTFCFVILLLCQIEATEGDSDSIWSYKLGSDIKRSPLENLCVNVFEFVSNELWYWKTLKIFFSFSKETPTNLGWPFHEHNLKPHFYRERFKWHVFFCSVYEICIKLNNRNITLGLL